MNTNMKELNAQELAMANGGAYLAGGFPGDPTFPPVVPILPPLPPIFPVLPDFPKL